jgi:DNA-binding SARP family transcriptional activator/tetratricopeptide (TPR) repeat protein
VPGETEYCLLGPLLVRRGGAALPALPGKQRVVLAALLLRANRMVSVQDLVVAVWGSSEPASARATLLNYVKELRKALAAPGGSPIETVPGGYLIRVGPDGLDVLAFEELRTQALLAAGAGAWARASECWHAAGQLWRGDPLADVPSEVLAVGEVPRLAEMRRQAVEGRIEADLHLGLHHAVVPELRQLTALHPLRERLHGLLMLALYRDGQQAEALAAYQRARQVVRDELGAEPGAELRNLQQQILAADPALAGPVLAAAPASGTSQSQAGAHGTQSRPMLPRQLPAGVQVFAGRTAELAELDRLLDEQAGSDGAPAVVISALSGTAGVGKTTLAVRWAHSVAHRFPDGQLYVNLRGYDPAQPMSTADALAGFLRALGIPSPDIPAEPGERAAQYRSLLAGRRILILLDNAGSADQVRPLLPATPGCAAVVTSRDTLAGLVARDGARRLDLDVLSLADAVGLLRTLIGGRVEAEPDAAAALAASCCRLPLALRVAAELAASRPAASLASLADELADQQQRLDLLDAGGDSRTAVRAVLSWSVRRLDPDTFGAFRVLGLHPGPDFDACAAAALTGSSPKQARYLLDQLGRAHLIQPAGPGRYSMHDLLRDYARELAAAEDGADGQQAALTRLLDYYLHGAAAAMDTLYPAEQHLRPRLAALATAAPALTEPEEAMAWLAAELACLVAVIVQAASGGWPRHAIHLSSTLFRYLDSDGHYSEAVTIYTQASRAAGQAGDVAAEAGALTCLGVAEIQQGRCEAAAPHLERALPLSRQAADRVGEARVLSNLGFLAYRQGRYEEAAGYYQLALSGHSETGNRFAEAVTLSNLGTAEVRLGHSGEGTRHFEQALALSREIGDQGGEAYALINLGEVNLRQGHYELAAPYLRQILAICRAARDRVGEAGALLGLGELELRRGRNRRAAGYLQNALILARDMGSQQKQAEALDLLGEVSLATGDHRQAGSHYAAALELASRMGDTYQQARAYDGLGSSYRAGGDHEQARDHWQHALTRYAEMGTPEADQVRAKLTEHVAS